MKDREVVIVVPGAKYINSRNSFIKNIILLFYRSTRILKPVYTNYTQEWLGKFEQENRKVVWLRWNRGFTIWSRWLGYCVLKKEVLYRKRLGYRVKVVGISLGGEIAVKVLEKLGSGYIDKVVLICSANTDKEVNVDGTKIYNIYSTYDLFIRLAIKLLAPIHGGMILGGDFVENIEIKNFSHDKFCSDDLIEVGKYKDNRITDLVKEFLK
jgi:hypothetical protein